MTTGIHRYLPHQKFGVFCDRCVRGADADIFPSKGVLELNAVTIEHTRALQSPLFCSILCLLHFTISLSDGIEQNII